jgi:glucose/arabinose dehydrogenase
MRFGGYGGRFALSGALWVGALWAAAAGAQPVIVDPASGVDWELRTQPVVSGLASPSALVFFGSLADEEFLVLEKDTGRVRHFVQRVDQGDALDLAVDNCGERGLVGIVLHPSFDPTPTPAGSERPPSQDWVYLSYHTDAGRTADGCDLDAVHRVERYVWSGTLLVPDPLVEPDPDTTDAFDPFVPFERSVDATTAVGGTLATSVDQSFDLASFPARLYVALGSLERDGKLQNNRLAADELDDTGVILRLDENGKASADNPFDHDLDQLDPEDRYFAYGLRDPRGLAVDPFSDTRDRQLWFTEQSDGGLDAMPDEINRGFAGTNGGYRSLQGRATTVFPNTDPNYALVDLEQTTATPPVPVSTYRNPAFSFEDKAIAPTGLAFGGREMGPQHLGSLFVGAANGRLFRYGIDAPRIGFVLTDPLVDTVAAAADDLTQIVVGEGFGTISDVETGLDGSLYVLGTDPEAPDPSSAGAIHRVFRDALRDLAVTRVKVPTRISLSAKRPTRSKRIRLTLENRGEVVERIVGREALVSLLGLEIDALPPANCPAPTASLIDPPFVRPPYGYAIGLKPKGKLKLSIDVVWECASPSPAGSFDFETRFDLNGAAIGIVDENPENDLCPRPRSGADKGCGKKGAPLQTDVIRK